MGVTGVRASRLLPRHEVDRRVGRTLADDDERRPALHRVPPLRRRHRRERDRGQAVGTVRCLVRGDLQPRLRGPGRVLQLAVRPADAAVTRPHVLRVLEEGAQATEPQLHSRLVVLQLREGGRRCPALEEGITGLSENGAWQIPVGTLRAAVPVQVPALLPDGRPGRGRRQVDHRLDDADDEDRRSPQATGREDQGANPYRAQAPAHDRSDHSAGGRASVREAGVRPRVVGGRSPEDGHRLAVHGPGHPGQGRDPANGRPERSTGRRPLNDGHDHGPRSPAVASHP